jgi:hypothetical protein
MQPWRESGRAMRRKQWPKEVRAEIIARTNGKCGYCGSDVGDKAQLDHIVAYGLGGTDTEDNLLASCQPCNYIKQTLSIKQFRVYLAGMTKTLHRDSVTYRNAIRFGRIAVIDKSVIFYAEQIGLYEESPITGHWIKPAAESSRSSTLDQAAGVAAEAW